MAAAQYYEQIQQAYIAYYGRPADPAGQAFWAMQMDKAGGNINVIINAFGNSAESTALYAGSNTAAQVNAIYHTLFGRDADVTGLNFYVNGIQNGTFTLASVALNVYNGAIGTDAAKLAAKLTYADAFTTTVSQSTAAQVAYGGNAAASNARAALAAVVDTASETTAAAALSTTIANIGTGAVAQTFTLTNSVDNIVGTAGNDVINGTISGTAGATTLTALDKIDGGAGNDTLNITDTATLAGGALALPTGLSVTNVETANIATAGSFGDAAGPTVFDISGWTGLQTANLIATGTLGSDVKVADTTALNLTVATNNAVKVAGGSSDTVVNGGTGSVSISGAKLVSANVSGGGVISVDDLVSGTSQKTLTSVSLSHLGGAANLTGDALKSVTVTGPNAAIETITVTNTTANHTLNVAVNGAGVDSTGAAQALTFADANAGTIAITATGAANNVILSTSAADTNLTAVTVAGAGKLALNLDGANNTAVASFDGSAATGDLTLSNVAVATVAVKTGAGADSFTTTQTAAVNFDLGAGNDVLTIGSAIAAGSTIQLGAGDDSLLAGVGGSVAASTSGHTTVIDGGAGVNTVSASLINAANAAEFVNFQHIDASAAANLDISLLTGTTITGVTLSGGAGNATLTNLASGAGLSVSGANSGITDISVAGATANTADVFNIGFNGVATSAATAALPTAASANVVLHNIETVNIASTGTGFVANNLALTDGGLKTLAITGDKALSLTFVGTNGTNGASGGAVSLIDGSAATGKLTINTANVTADSASTGLTVNGGSNDDTITLAQKATVNGGAGDDTIVSSAQGGTFSGGAGHNTFDVSAAVTGGTTVATSVIANITDLHAGDTIKLGAASAAFNATKVTLGSTVTNLDSAIAAALANDTTAGHVSWFQYGNNTYVVENVAASATAAATDIVVKLTGNVDLSHTTFASNALHIA
jgi:S-layer protein